MPSLDRTAAKAPRKSLPAPEAQAQILNAVDDLFYREGARAVGVDAVVKRAGVNKMCLYRQFESKDALLMHYLERREETFWGYIDASLDKHPGDAEGQLRQVFRDVAERAGKPEYRGCAFVNIAVEFPDRDHPARHFVAACKGRLLDRLISLADRAGAADPAQLGQSLALLLEGAYASSQTYGPDRHILQTLARTADTLIDTAIP